MLLSETTNATPVVCYTYQMRLLALFGERKAGQTSSQHVPYVLGYTHVTMNHNNESRKSAMTSKSQKLILSGDWSLQLDSMNLDLVVIAGQLYRGEYVLASCTHRPSNQQSRQYMNCGLAVGVYRRR